MSTVDARGDAAADRGALEKATAARDVRPGEPWTFPDHRTMASVIAEEEAA
jgi:hypothetical protein